MSKRIMPINTKDFKMFGTPKYRKHIIPKMKRFQAAFDVAIIPYIVSNNNKMIPNSVVAKIILDGIPRK